MKLELFIDWASWMDKSHLQAQQLHDLIKKMDGVRRFRIVVDLPVEEADEDLGEVKAEESTK